MKASMSPEVGYPEVKNRSRSPMDLCFERRLGSNTSWLWDLLDKPSHA